MYNGQSKLLVRLVSEGVRSALKRSPFLVITIMAVIIALAVVVGLAAALRMTESAYSDLLYRFKEISGEYNVLSRSNDLLVERYSGLAERYSLLDLPLNSKKIPSIRELELWLQIDNTDESAYNDPDFACLHFSVLLMLRGRAQHYDIGVVAVYGHHNETEEPFSHSVNAIITTEGLVYIEPQLDKVWWFEDHSQMTVGTTHEFPISEDPIYVENIAVFFHYR